MINDRPADTKQRLVLSGDMNKKSNLTFAISLLLVRTNATQPKLEDQDE